MGQAVEIALRPVDTCSDGIPQPRTNFAGVSLFSGIGGFELGFERQGGHTKLLCEVDDSARAVLKKHLPFPPLARDVTRLGALPVCDVVFAGFPCQDLSQVGQTRGIDGSNSYLVSHIFRLLAGSRQRPEWVIFENVPFMLHLAKGRGIKYLVESLESLGYRWSYRVIDAMSFGIPQRRRRVVLVASLESNKAKDLLLSQDEGGPHSVEQGRMAGFYWTEGNRGLGWAENGTPPIKGGSGIGIPAPPAVWNRETGFIGTPSIRDAERLQGFDRDWTAAAGSVRKRWRLVGNAIPVTLSEWLFEAMLEPGTYQSENDVWFSREGSWPKAAWGEAGQSFGSSVSEWPRRSPIIPLHEYLHEPLEPLSLRASAGFLKRAKRSTLRFKPGFLDAVEAHIVKSSS